MTIYPVLLFISLVSLLTGCKDESHKEESSLSTDQANQTVVDEVSQTSYQTYQVDMESMG
ncbi:hypothetical protein LCGC14_2415040, partial [marine sediment metagenome]